MKTTEGENAPATSAAGTKAEKERHCVVKCSSGIAIIVRKMTLDDIPGALSAERSMDQVDIWEEKDFRALIQDPGALAFVACCADVGGPVLGYCALLFRKNSVALYSVSIHEHVRRMGIGRALVEEALVHPRARKFAWQTSVVRASNLTAQLFLKAIDFKVPLGKKEYLVEDQYDFPPEDGYLFYRKREHTSKGQV